MACCGTSAKALFVPTPFGSCQRAADCCAEFRVAPLQGFSSCGVSPRTNITNDFSHPSPNPQHLVSLCFQ